MRTLGNRDRAGRARRRRQRRPLLGVLEGRVLLTGVDVTQYHNDPFLSGANLGETTLTPSNVNPTDFGLLFSHAVDGYVYAEPLYLSGVSIGGAVHNVAFVATQNDTVYAFDADSAAGADAQPLWVHGFTDPANGITAVPQDDVISHDIVPFIGITGTPVIDASTGTLYVVTKTKEILNGDTAHPHYVQTLHALDVATGKDKIPGGYVIGDTVENPDGSLVNDTAIQVAGTGDDSVNGVVTFNALRESQRPALQLYPHAGQTWVIVAWASHGDNGPYHGWLAAFDASTLHPVAWFNVDPNGSGAGIWQSGDPPAYDPATGAIYFATGNGTFDQYGSSPNNDYGESVIRLNGTPTGNQFTVQDFFTPYEFDTLNGNDADLGSGGTMLLPDSVGSPQHRHLMVETGKSGKIYLIDRDDMGKVSNPGTGPDANVQTVTAGQAGVWGSPSFLQVNSTTGIIYYHGSGDVLKGYYITDGHIEDGSRPGDHAILTGNFEAGFPGTQPVISANGTAGPTSPADAILWELQVDQYGSGGPSVLRAYDALNPANELYDSSMTDQRDQPGIAVKFTVPTVANGRVYVGAAYSFSVFGLFPEATAAPATPTGLNATTVLGQGSTIQLSWTNPAPAAGAAATGIVILRSTDGVNFTSIATVSANATSFTDPGPFTIGQPYTYEIEAVNQVGTSVPSASAQVSVMIEKPTLTITNVTATTVALSWTEVANDHYAIERSSHGGNFAVIATVPASRSSYLDIGLAAGMYTYRVDAFNASPTTSSVSDVKGATVGPTVDESIGFDNTAGLTANGSAQFAEGTARLTNAVGQVGSVFTNNRFTIGRFHTTFTVRLHEGTQPEYADGITFVIQAVSPTAVGQGLGGLGYQGIGRSIAIKLDPFRNPGDPSGSSTGLFENGEGPFGGVDTTTNGGPLINSQATKQITLSYDGTTLTETITNTLDPSETFTTSYQVDIPGVIGSDTAYVGFTGSTGDGGFWELQDVTGWTFTSTEPLPGGPTDLRATGPSPTEIDLSWTSNSYNESGFAVERSKDGVNFTQIGTTDATSYQDKGLATGTYYYRVRAFNNAGSSSYSNTLKVATGILFDHSAGFANHSDMSANGNTDWNGGELQLTNGYFDNASSSFYLTPVPILDFTTTFTFRMRPGVAPPPIADGFTFTIQDDPAGLAALGADGGGLGYQFITKSVAIKFDAYKPDGDHSSTGLYVNGDFPDAGAPGPGDVYVPLDGTGINFNAAATDTTPHTFQVTLAYDGTTLTETITDETTKAGFTTQYTINLPAYLGSKTAYVGFTGGTGGSTSIQDIDSWTGAFFSPPADTTPPTSRVDPLAPRQSKVTFPITVTGTDPIGPGGAPPSGIASFTIYVSTNGGPWKKWTTVAPTSTSGAKAAAMALFTGQSNTIYAFYSTATDAAGNVRAYRPLIEASTYVPDLSPPVTAISGGSYNGDGTITLHLSGHDVGGGLLDYSEVRVSIDGHAPVSIGPAIPAGVPDAQGNDASTIRYVIPPAEDNGVSHSYVFSTAGIDSSGNVEAAHATPGQGRFSVAYTPPAASKLAISGVTVEHGAAERSYIRYLDVAFNNSQAALLQAIIKSVNSPAPNQAPELTLTKYDLNGGGTPVPVSLKGLLSIVDNAIEIDFGAGGLGGSPNTTAADGYYALAFRPPPGQGAGSTHHFFRLLGDVTGDGVVNNNDLYAIAAEIHLSSPAGFAPLGADVNGDGTVSALDLTLATRAKGHKLKAGLPLR